MAVHEETGVTALLERLGAAADLLEQAAGRINIGAAASSRESALEQRLAEASATIASLKAGRKTLPAGVATLLAKDGNGNGTVDITALDAAMTSLSLEQRIAVKAHLLRAGMIG